MMVSSSEHDIPGLLDLGPSHTGYATDCDWLIAQLHALYRYDQRGRIVSRRDPSGAESPRFHFGRTRHGNLWRLRAGLATDLCERLSRLASREPALPSGPPPWSSAERSGAIRVCLDEQGATPKEWRGPVFRLPDARESLIALDRRAAPAGRVEPADPRSLDEIGAAFPRIAENLAALAPIVVVREGGVIASLAYTACGDPAVVAECGVDTLEPRRQRGHGAAAVAGWLRQVRSLGGTPLYSTSWDNRSSLALAQTLGLVPFAETTHWT